MCKNTYQKMFFFRQVNTLITLSRFRGELTSKKAYDPNTKKDQWSITNS